jgi:RNA polymerase sigma-70 factor (ECF subfamily)
MMEIKPVEGITQLLVRWGEGDRAALDELMPQVYNELRRLAVSHLRREAHCETMQPTALVHEAYLRLVDQRSTSWQNRAQFFGLAAKLMRNILVDHARQSLSQKRGGSQLRVSLTTAEQTSSVPDLNLIELDDALRDLAIHRPRHCQTVELRFFGGLTIQETASVLEVSHATVEREWKFAKAWLKREISRNQAEILAGNPDRPAISVD